MCLVASADFRMSQSVSQRCLSRHSASKKFQKSWMYAYNKRALPCERSERSASAVRLRRKAVAGGRLEAVGLELLDLHQAQSQTPEEK